MRKLKYFITIITIITTLGLFNIDDTTATISNETIIDTEAIELNIEKQEPIIKIEERAPMRASWYGPKFHGKLAANGEIYDQMALTAAHKTLPFGTMLKLTNPSNGKSVLVRINDRGPYIEGRHIDLSKAAAIAVGSLEKGVITVNVEQVSTIASLTPSDNF